MSTSTSGSTTAAVAAVGDVGSNHEGGGSGGAGGGETSVWITLGGLALGVGGFFLVKGLHYLYRQQQQREEKWIEKWSRSESSSSLQQQQQEQRLKKCIYLDYNGTTPIYRDVLKAMLPYFEDHFGNPSSNHTYGIAPRLAIQHARRQLLYGLLQKGRRAAMEDETNPTDNQDEDPTTVTDMMMEETRFDSIWFTGCGTESDNLAIELAIQSSSQLQNCGDGGDGSSTINDSKKQKMHIVTSNVEHPAIERYLKYLEGLGTVEVTYVPVQTDGRVLASDVIAAIRDKATILVTIMYANNESGALQPIKEISTECRKRKILFHTDAAQAAGKVSCALADLGYPDMMTIVGHKLGAPKGIAALYVRPGCLEEEGRRQMPPSLSSRGGIMLIGGGQEFGRRGGTENTPYIVGLGYAAEKAQMNLERNSKHMEGLRSRLLKSLQDQLGEENVQANGPVDPTLRLCNTLSVGIKNVHSGQLLSTIGHLVAASAGAACHSNEGVSSVLQAMKVPMEFARGTLRLSVGPKMSTAEIDRAAWIIAETIKLQWSGELPSISSH